MKSSGKSGNMVSNKTVSQSGSGGASAKINYAVGSGSRPGKSRVTIDSSNPNQSQMIRPKNTIGGTGYKG